MRIVQIDSAAVCGPARVGKWYCSESAQPIREMLARRRPRQIFQYLQADGTWGKVAHYFDTKEEIEQLLLTSPACPAPIETNWERQYWDEVDDEFDDPSSPFGGEFEE